MRPGCAGPAAVRLVFDAVDREVWLDEFTDEPPGSSMQAQFLCSLHAARLGVPIGWSVVDRRTPLAAGAQPTPVQPEPAPEPQPEPAPEPEPEPEPAPEPEPEPEPEPVREPELGEQLELAPVLDPEPGSMLGRAFAWAGSQRSAITERPDGAGPDDPEDPESDS